jgi:hypothetical protein
LHAGDLAPVVLDGEIEIGLTRHHGRAARAGADRRLVRSGQSEGDDRRVVPGAPIPRLLVRSGSASLKSGTISSNPSSSSRESSERPTALSGKA